MPAAALLLLAIAAPAARAGEPIMPLSDVRAGMGCQGATVVSGLEPVPFDVQVISVEGGPRPSDASIIVRVSGEVVAATGIAQGFSGSPVRCPGPDGTPRIIGAIAYGIGQYDNMVGGVTPIEAMLAMPTLGLAPATPAIGQAPAAKSVPAKVARRAATSATASSRAAAPRLPLMLAGPRGALSAAFTKAAAKAGIPLVVTAQGRRSQTAAAGGLKPGDSIAATSVFGDVDAYALGTVTYVDGPNVYAFGHPYNGTGPSRILMERAQVSTVIASPTIADQSSFKVGSPVGAIGTLGFDGGFGVGGLLGAIPGTIQVKATVRDAGGAVVQEATASVVDERPVRGGQTADLLPVAAAANAGTALQRLTKQPALGGSARACTTVHLKGGAKPLSQCVDTIVPKPTAEGGVETGVADAVGSAVAPMTSAARFLGLVDRVDVDVRLRAEADAAEIVKLVTPSRVRAGWDATIRVVVVQESTGKRREIPVKVRIPRYAAGQSTGIVILADALDAAAATEVSLDELFAEEDAPAAPKSLAELRKAYTPAGLSGLRALVVPGVPGSAVKGALTGSEDSDLDEDDLAELASRAKLVWELPSVALSGAVSATVTPR